MKVNKIIEKVKPKVNKVKDFIMAHKTPTILTIATSIGALCYPGVVIIVLQHLGKYIDSAVNYGGRELTKQTADLLVEEFQILPNFDLINLVLIEDTQFSKKRNLEVSLGMIDISEPNIEDFFIFSVVRIFLFLHYSNSNSKICLVKFV